jgi:Fe-S oxidoreductase
VGRLGDHAVTLAELPTNHTPGWQPPRLARHVLAQLHCHQRAIMRWDADSELLTAAGAQVEHLESGSCRLAGNFGLRPGHAEVSRACAEHVLLPRLREASPGAVVLADGFSCRTQIHELDSGGPGGDAPGRVARSRTDLPRDYPERGRASVRPG